jgi:hypothetical protein
MLVAFVALLLPAITPLVASPVAVTRDTLQMVTHVQVRCQDIVVRACTHNMYVFSSMCIHAGADGRGNYNFCM